MAAARTLQAPASRDIVHAVHRRQQQLLLLDEMLPVIRMQRLELRLVKSQKLFNPAAAAEIAELKVILAAINLFQPQPMQPAQRIPAYMHSIAYDTGEPEFQHMFRVPDYDSLLMTTVRTLQYLAVLPSEIRDIQYMDAATALAIKSR